ncbi:MAG: hypothetical protein FWG99_07530 [Treponema sp.]|nr:hypothetical protein [Treponema sp.]
MKPGNFAVILAFLLYLLIFSFSCDPFTGTHDNDLLKKIDEEIAWANAAKLTVRVDYPVEWGASPQQGDLNRDNTRKGYEFNVEFTPMPGYGFEKWLAFPAVEYNGLDKIKTAAEVEGLAFNSSSVRVTLSEGASGAKIAAVTIFTDTPVTLVPWCSNRPSLDQQTNPPLNPILTPFPYDQRVNIWFNMPVNTSTISLTGESPTIRVTGIWASGNERGQPFNMNGENGDLRNYFDIEYPPAPDPANPHINNRVNLIPNANAHEIALLTVTVTVGPGIESESGVAMTVPTLISYQTDTTEARKVYRAGNVRASEALASGYFRDAEFSRPDIDRRFSQNTNNTKNTVYIRFTVEAPEDAPDSNPNKIIIVEHRLFSLRGFDLNPGSTNETTYLYPGPCVSLAGGEFTVTHTLETALSGIVQMAVLPWYDGTPAVEEMPVNEAISEGRYVTIVIDDAAPDVENPQPVFSGDYQIDNGVYVYGLNVPMTLALNGLSGIIDNGGEGGIPASRAYSLPWTMDESENLYWYAMIGVNAATETVTSGKRSVNNGLPPNNQWTLADLSGLLTEDTEYRVFVKYEDTLGNITPNWTATGLRVMYSSAVKESVANIKAYCNTNGDEITLSWEENSPGWTSAVGTYPYPEIVISTYRSGPSGDIEENTQTITRSRGAVPYNFSVPQIITNRVRDGEAVSNVYGYKISIVTQNIAGPMTTGPIWVYNIPDMTIAAANTVLLTQENFTAILQAVNSNEQIAIINYVLTGDIEVTDWEPVDLSGKNFYGNGHSVIIRSINAAADMGLFGVLNDGLVRDLTVFYETAAGSTTPVSINPTDAARFGGIAGTAQGSVQFINMLVKGAATFTVSGNTDASVGGLGGQMTGTSSIHNAYGGLNLRVEKASDTASGSINVGGIAGDTSGGTIKEVSVMGNISVGRNKEVNTVASIEQSNTGLHVGGLVGLLHNSGLEDADYRQGSIFVSSNNGTARMGGALGRTSGSANVDSCSAFAREFTVNKTGSGSQFYAAGFVGDFYGGAAVNCSGENSVVITTSLGANSDKNVGGFAGRINADISYCYATGDISVTGYGIMYAGGFTARTVNSPLNTISNSYATGNVVITSLADNEIFAGGFIGRLYMNLENCYATGNVTVDKPNSGSIGTIHAGGLAAGITQTTASNGSVDRCFATGTVIVNRNHTSGTTNAGGLMGLEGMVGTYSKTISNSAALGQSVTVTGGSTTYIGRIFASGYNTNKSNNRTFNGMRLFSDTYANRDNPAQLNITTAPVPVLGGSCVFSNTDFTAPIVPRSISGFTLSDPGGSGISGVSMATTLSSGGETGSPVWEGGISSGRITGVDLSKLTADGQSFQFTFTIMTNAGSWSVYQMSVTRNSATSFAIGVLIRTDSSPTTAKTHNNQHGQDATDSEFRRIDIWRNVPPASGTPPTVFNGLGFSAAHWDFSQVANWGYPFLRGVNGVGLLGGQ